ncbi:YkvA family protein [Botryobacter ruber]|uniref:YkvA family protein n=1 Tax=Botryobacter ruber TaxID=2171629 RepID=UPI000E0B3AA5|nr:DUF1232 domain-containing protein [Botryobacter ruber]
MVHDLVNKGLKLTQHPLFKSLLGKAGGILAKPAKIGMLITTAYAKLVDTESTQSGFEQLKEVMFTFMRLVKAYATGRYRNVATKSMLIGVGVLLYLVTPLDVIPDFIPVIGLLDDISLMAWFIEAFHSEIEKFKEWEEIADMEPGIGTL